jgi:DNA modification methylase
MSKAVLAEGVELYLGDCWDILPKLGKVDAVVTDPPYGVEGTQNTKTSARGPKRRKNDYASFVDSKTYVRDVIVPAFRTALARAKRGVVTPGNRCLTLYPEPDSFGVIWQPASVGLQPWGRADSQPILYYGKSPYGGTALPGKSCSFQQAGYAVEAIDHPCPKPIDLMKAILANSTLPGEMVLDPFMGSGTTGVAAVSMGRRFVGIEIEAKYFDIACRRIADALARPDLFIEKPKPIKQEAML